MKYILSLTVFFCLTAISLPVMAHHMAEGMVDEEIYAMIDSMVADTPHVEIIDAVFDESTTGNTKITIIYADAVKFLEDLIGDGIMDYFPMLDGDVSVEIVYSSDNTRSATMTIFQVVPQE